MAGSGKTTLIQRLNAHLHAGKLPGYIINLDPAVTHLPYSANVDIRDTVRGWGAAAAAGGHGGGGWDPRRRLRAAGRGVGGWLAALLRPIDGHPQGL
jgi:hypothetical protein